MSTQADPLPTDLATAHAMILAQRDLLAEARAIAVQAQSFKLEIERLKLQLEKARRARFGQSSERGRQIVEQLELAIADLEETQAEVEAKAVIEAAAMPSRAPSSSGTRKPARRPLPDHLPRERIVYPSPCVCGKCGGTRLRKLGEIVTESLECEPRRWKVVQHVRETMTCRDCESVSEAPAPSHPVARGRAGPHLLALVLASKYGQHLPLNRQSEIYAREGATIEVSTLADWVGACAASLEPIVARIRAHVLAAERVHADDTTVPILAKGKTVTGRLWTYVRDDRPFGGSDPPAAAFFASRDRTGTHPEAHLASFSGLMQADAYAGFNRLYAPGRKPGPIVEAGCFAHARRKLFDLAKVAKAPIATEAVMKIDALFAIEREINGRSAAERLVVRRGRMRPIVDELEIWLIAQRAKLSTKSDLAKAITYSLKRWTALTRFLDDGRICMTNNAAERALRGVAIGRANWTFAGSDRGAQRAAAIYTLTETCKLNGVDPQAYLADVLARLPDYPARRIDDLMPWNWARSERALPAVFTGCVRFKVGSMRVEVLGGVERRRRWSRDEKMRILAESLEPGAKVAPSLLFSWRRQARPPAAASTTMVPVTVAEPFGVVPAAPTKPRKTRGPAKERGLIEIDLGGGRRVRVDAGVDAKALARVLDVLSSR